MNDYDYKTELHPYYGPCDGFGPNGGCSECAGVTANGQPMCDLYGVYPLRAHDDPGFDPEGRPDPDTGPTETVVDALHDALRKNTDLVAENDRLRTMYDAERAVFDDLRLRHEALMNDAAQQFAEGWAEGVAAGNEAGELTGYARGWQDAAEGVN